MTAPRRTAVGLGIAASAWLLATVACAQTQDCSDGSSLASVVSSASTSAVIGLGDDGVATIATLATVVPSGATVPTLNVADEDVQWCVDASDPRCAPDPAGAPAAHLAHAGDAGQVPSTMTVPAAPSRTMTLTDRVIGALAVAHRNRPERPPTA